MMCRLTPDRPSNRPFAALAALLAVLAAISAVALAGAPAASAEPVAITDGTLAWGVKTSWRQYAGPGEQSGGVTQDAGGVYQFPIESGSYDPETRTTTIQAKGSIHWQSHWYPNEASLYAPPAGYVGSLELYVLDVTIKDPRLTISAAGSVLSVEAISRKVTTWELVDLGRTDFAELDPTTATQSSVAGATSWSGIGTALTPDGATGVFGGNYSTGQAVDPVAFSYTGEGGVPDFSEHWTEPDSNGLELAKNGTFGAYSAQVGTWLIDPVRGIVHDTLPEGSTQKLQAFDLHTGEHIGSPLLLTSAVLSRIRSAPFVDPANAVAYYSSAGTTAIDSMLRWNPETEAYEQSTFAPFTVASVGRALWDRHRQRWLKVVRVVPAGAGSTDYAAHEWYVFAYERVGGGSFSERRYRLPDAPVGWNRSWYNAVMNSAAVAADGSILLPRTSLTAQAGITAAPLENVGVQRIVLDDSTETASVSEIPGSEVPLANNNELEKYDFAFANPNGYFSLVEEGIGPTLPTHIHQYRLGEDGAAVPVGGEVTLTQAKNAIFAIDPVDGTIWQSDNSGQRLTGVRDGRVVFSKSFPYVNTRTAGLGTLDDRSVWIQSSDGTPATLAESSYGWARFARTGYSPTVTADPTSTSITVEPTATQPVTFTTVATGTPAPTLRWQRRAPGSARFADLPGETGATLTVQAGAGDNGAAYRAIATNAAGELATEPAELEVRYRPTISFDVVDRGGAEGTDITFDLLAGGGPEPTITWQRRVGGFWEAVDLDSGDFAVEGNKLTVKGVNTEMNGAQFRAKLTNPVGTVYSRAAKLTVASAAQEPVTFGSGSLEWGFANRWRCYVTGTVAHGGIELSGGVTRIPGTEASGSLCPGAGESSQALRFPVRGGEYDPETGSLEVKMNGVVRFWGHVTGGTPALDTTFSDLRLVAAGETGTLYADTTGATMDNPTPVSRDEVPLVTVDLSGTGPAPNGAVGLDWSGAETKLTAQGAEVFGSYPEGEPFDPIAIGLVFGTPQPDPGPETQPAPRLPSPLPAAEAKGPAARINAAEASQTLGSNRIARLGTLACPSVAPCKVVAPNRVRVKVAGKRFGAPVLAPRWIAAGQRGELRVRLPKGAAKRLQSKPSRKATVAVKVSVLANGNTTTQSLRVVVRG